MLWCFVDSARGQWGAVIEPPSASEDEPAQHTDEELKIAEVFDEPAQWRAEVIEDLHLRGAERCAAACPGPGYPQLLATVIEGLDDSPPGAWVDVGAGLGGVADWLTRRTRRTIVALEPNAGSVHGAKRLFPLLTLVQGGAEHLPFPDASVPGVVVSGVISLFDAIDGVIGETARVLPTSGVLAFTDIWSTTDTTVSAPPNTLWAVEDVVAVADANGFDSVGFAICSTSTGWWSKAAEQVDEVIERRYRSRPGFEAWQADRAHIKQIFDDGLVMAGACVFTRR
jgi:SAM-dependent methyltransferase